MIIAYRFCAEGAYYGSAGENFAGFCGREENFTGLQAPQAKILRVFAAAKEHFAVSTACITYCACNF